MADRRGDTASGAWPLAAGLLIGGTIACAASLGRRTSPTDDHPAIRDWYDGLDKPPFTPPPIVFGIAWPLIETALAIGAYRLLRRPPTRTRNAALVITLANQAGLVGWNELFFGRRAMGVGTMAAGVLVASSATYCVTAKKTDRAAAAAGVPLTLWLGFATILAGSVWRRNRRGGSDRLAEFATLTGRHPAQGDHR